MTKYSWTWTWRMACRDSFLWRKRTRARAGQGFLQVKTALIYMHDPTFHSLISVCLLTIQLRRNWYSTHLIFQVRLTGGFVENNHFSCHKLGRSTYYHPESQICYVPWRSYFFNLGIDWFLVIVLAIYASIQEQVSHPLDLCKISNLGVFV